MKDKSIRVKYAVWKKLKQASLKEEKCISVIIYQLLQR